MGLCLDHSYLLSEAGRKDYLSGTGTTSQSLDRFRNCLTLPEDKLGVGT